MAASYTTPWDTTLYARASSERIPVWKMKGSGVKDATTEIRGIFDQVAEKMELTHG